METKAISTMVKSDHKVFGQNAYVLGRITGIAYVICNEGPTSALRYYANGDVAFDLECTEDQYKTFAKTVEKLYPDVCIFDVTDVLSAK